MNIFIHPANERGYADHGWLKSYHHFSFADFYDQSKIRFGALRVVNDDWIVGNGGFDTHPHENMEIVTIVQSGAIEHKDTLGNQYQITAGEVQRMSAGTGISHSERNASETKEVNLFQIWVFPKEKGIAPSYEQKRFDPAGADEKLQLLVSPDGEAGSLKIHQNAWFSQARLTKRMTYTMHGEKSGLYLICTVGKIKVGAAMLGTRDSIGITDTKDLQIEPLEKSEFLAIEIPMV